MNFVIKSSLAGIFLCCISLHKSSLLKSGASSERGCLFLRPDRKSLGNVPVLSSFCRRGRKPVRVDKHVNSFQKIIEVSPQIHSNISFFIAPLEQSAGSRPNQFEAIWVLQNEDIRWHLPLESGGGDAKFCTKVCRFYFTKKLWQIALSYFLAIVNHCC